jgi:O-antigen ligase
VHFCLQGTIPPMTTDAASANTRVLRAVVVCRSSLIALPFVFPFASGPLISAWQQLAAWVCAAFLLAIGPSAQPARRLAIWLAVVAASILLGRVGNPAFELSAVCTVAAAGLMACVGAGLARASTLQKAALPAGLLAAGFVSAVLGLLQYYGLADPLVPWTASPELGQAYGNLRQRNQFATLISMTLIALLWLHAMYGRRARAALLPVAVLLLFAAAASTSRTGLLQLLLICGTAVFLALRELRKPVGETTRHRLPAPWLLLALLGVYFAASWLLPWIAATGVETMLQRVRQGAPDTHSRLVLWHNVLELIAQRPWTGWGWGELKFAHYSTLYPGPRFADILDNAHNLPLHLAVELGIPAAVLICGGFSWIVLAAHPWRETDPTRLMAWGVLAMIVLHSLLEYPLWYGPFQLVFGLCLGILWPAAPSASQRPRLKWLTASVLSKTASIALLAIVGYAGWDYTRISQLYLALDDRLPAYRDDTQAKVQDSWLFAAPVQFAELALTPVTSANANANAAEVHALAQRVLHFSPEPRVIVKLIESATLLGLQDEAFAQAARFKIAYPADYERWLQGQPIDDPSE